MSCLIVISSVIYYRHIIPKLNHFRIGAGVAAQKAVVVGAGVGGLVAGLLLSARGVSVTIVERSSGPGGKMRQVEIAGTRVDAGPTVFTMRPVFEEIFAAAGASLSDYVSLRPTEILARHAWSASERLDLFADLDRSADAIGDFAGAQEARGYRDFCAHSRRIYEALDRPFIRSARPSLNALIASFGIRRLGDLWQLSPFNNLWNTLGKYFRDVRLRQLFARYATYCGSSPFLAPATLMLVAHVEREGVWLVEGGMHRLAEALAAVATGAGATLRYQSEVAEVIVGSERVAGVMLSSGERIDADTVLVNADPAAVSRGRLGRAIAAAVPSLPRSARSLSAITWAMVARTRGFPLVRHNVFFSNNYEDEFKRIRRGRLPAEPTVYVCAQHRTDTHTSPAPNLPEPLLCLVNAPPCDDGNADDGNACETLETSRCDERTFATLERSGLQVERRYERCVMTTPREFECLYPATGGALYGPASHGWMASFRRPGSRTRIPGLYLAGGSTHPGPGVPMAAISGVLAAEAILADCALMRRFYQAATSGGMSMR
jgi:1-hydroxycarotenoid 3,4-desaturase